MITNQTLSYLISNKVRDARTLINNRRFPASVYIAGYAVEIALKYKICRSLGFTQGFPETREELNRSLAGLNQIHPRPQTPHITDIRNHDLSRLLTWSGEEPRIRALFHSEWTIVTQWDPEIRYRKLSVLGRNAELFFRSAKKIIKEIS
jgi:hypothetical protein